MTNTELREKLINMFGILSNAAQTYSDNKEFDKMYQIGLIMNEMYKTIMTVSVPTA